MNTTPDTSSTRPATRKVVSPFQGCIPEGPTAKDDLPCPERTHSPMGADLDILSDLPNSEAPPPEKARLKFAKSTTLDLVMHSSWPADAGEESDPKDDCVSQPSCHSVISRFTGASRAGRISQTTANRFSRGFGSTTQASRLRRASAIAVDFNLRAAMGTKESERVLQQPQSSYDMWRGPDDNFWARAQRWLLCRRTAFAMNCLVLIDFVIFTIEFSFEPSCERASERDAMLIAKAIRFACSIMYSAISLGQLAAFDFQPFFALFHILFSKQGGCLRNPIKFWFKRDDDDLLGANSSGLQDETMERMDSRSLLLLDITGLLDIVAQVVHLGEEPLGWVTAPQWISLLDIAKVWRFWAPSWDQSFSSSMLEVFEGFWAKIVQLLLSLFLFVHLCACIFSCVALYGAHTGQETWVDGSGLLQADVHSCRTRYSVAFYFAAYTVSTVGHGDLVPANTLEANIDSIIMVASQMYAANIFAEFTFQITTANYWRGQRHTRRTQTVAALKNMGVPRVLCQRVLAYQDFVWEVQKERRAKDSLGDLSSCLQEELKTIVYHGLVSQAPFLHQLSAASLKQIISSLVDTVHLPSDFIIARGEVGNQLFFLREGYAGIFLGMSPPHWKEPEVKVLLRGDYFGEVALLTGQQRTSWVMARTYCVCSELHKKTIEEVIAADPGCVVKLAKSMQKALNLQPLTHKWAEISSRLDKIYPDLEEIWCVFCTPINDFDREGNVLAWSGFTSLMKECGIQDCDQKLLWIDLDLDERGWVTFQKFVQVAYSGQRDAEADLCTETTATMRTAQARTNSNPIFPTNIMIAGPQETQGTNSANLTSSFHLANPGPASGSPHLSPTNLPANLPGMVNSSSNLRMASGVSDVGAPFLAPPTQTPRRLSFRSFNGLPGMGSSDRASLSMQFQITQLSDRFDSRLDTLAAQVRMLVEAVGRLSQDPASFEARNPLLLEQASRSSSSSSQSSTPRE